MEAGSVPLVEAAASLPSGEARISGTPLPSQTGGSFEIPTPSGGSPGREGNFNTPLPPQPGDSFASPTLLGSGSDLERLGYTPLPLQHGGTFENPTLPGSSPDQEGIGGSNGTLHSQLRRH